MSNRRSGLLVAAGLTILTLIVLHDQARHLFSVPDRGDPVFSIWRLAWVQHQLVADPRHLFDANIFYPLRATLTYSDAMILPAIAVWPLALFGVHPVVAYNLLLLATFVLSGLAAYALVRALGLSAAAGWVAAVAFALSPFRVNQLSHLEMQMTMWMPLVLLSIYRLVHTGRARYAVLAGVSLAAEWYSSMYFGLFLTTYAAVFAAALQIRSKMRLRSAVLTIGALAITAALVVPLGWEYARTRQTRGVWGLATVAEFSAMPSDYIRPAAGTAAHRRLLPAAVNGERALFPGFTVLILAIVGACLPAGGPRLAFVAAALIAFDGSLGVNGLLYGALYRVAFPFQSIRVPARFAILVDLTLVIFAARGVSGMLSRLTSRSVRFTGVAAVTTLFLLDAWPRYSTVPMWEGPPAVYQSLPASAVLFEFPVHPRADRFVENLPYMYFSIWHWRPMINGYSGFNPPEYAETVERTRGFPAPPTLDYLRGAGVTHVTVHCRYWESTACSAAMQQLDSSPRARLIARADWYMAPSSLYEIR